MAIRIERRMKSKMKEKLLLGAYGAAEYLGVSYPTVRNMIRKNNIPFVATGKRKFFPVKALDRLLEGKPQTARRPGAEESDE